jgi:acetyl esterase/lipase
MNHSARRLLSASAIILVAFFATVVPTRAQSSPVAPTDGAKTLSWAELSKMPLPPGPVARIPYGGGPQQFGELRVPQGAGPFPVMVLIHGGCYQNAFDFVYITRLAAWLTEQGVATWTIEYRRLGDEGGGWPGTFQDVANATDALRKFAPTSRIDLERVYAAGHSAGGQLALWLATRQKLPDGSELFAKDPLPIRGVLGLAAITDLAQYRKGPPNSCHASVEPLLGGTPETVAVRYAETSPKQRLPLGIPQVFIQGEKDPIVSADSVQAYADAAKKAGDEVVTLLLPKAGHFETSVPLPQTQARLLEALRLLLKPTAR